MRFNKSLVASIVTISLLGGCDSDDNSSTDDIQSEITTYTLTHSVAPLSTGSIASSSALTSFEEGAQVVLTATANSGYTFSGWEGDTSSSSINGNEITVTINTNTTITARFVEVVVEPIATQPSDIVINELRSDGGGFDYIELYNTGATTYTFAAGEWAVNDLKGFTEDLEPGIVIPAGTQIEAGGFLLIATDQNSVPFGVPAGTLAAAEGDTSFGLGKGDTALLVHNGEILAQQNYNDGTHVSTWGRLPDGGEWHSQDEALEATPGLANKLPDPVVAATANDIVINEVVSKGRDDIDFDFVELYNKSDEAYVFEEGEWSLIDGDINLETENDKVLNIPGGTEIAGKGFLILVPGEVVGSVLPANMPDGAVLNQNGDFGLGKGETITLRHNGETHEQIAYGDFHVNSYGRIPDGGDFIDLADGVATQLYASPGLKNFLTPETELSTTTINFTSFNADEATLEADGFRVFGKNADLATDVEPEYVAVSSDSSTAWVSLQENNGLARVDIATNTIEAILPLGLKDYGAVGNEIDGSDKDDAINLASYANVKGMYQPDGITTFERDGVSYVITANEGDVRDWLNGFEEGLRVEDATLDQSVFTNAATLQTDDEIGRLEHTQYFQSDSAETVFDTIYSYGARSFSIWNGETGAQVFDSGSDLATQSIAANVFPDDRSDAKGVEPESVTTGMVGDKHLAFVGLERADAVAVYDITDLSDVTFVEMLVTSGDDAPEGLLFISAANSPSGEALLVVSNEDSGNLTVYQANSEGEFELASRLLIEGGEGAAEISAYDPVSNKLFVVNNSELLNSSRIDVIDMTDPSNIVALSTIDASYYGAGINSVSVADGKLAAAIQAVNKTQQGTVALFDTATEKLIAITKVGALPDMVTFTPDGNAIITADEGEPDDDYLVDPIGSVSIIRFVE